MTPSARDWEKELAKIDKTMSSLSDDQLLERTAPPAPASVAAASPPRVVEGGRDGTPPSRLGLLVRVGLAVALAISIPFWPYAARCGLGLMGYLAAVAVVCTAGAWAAIASWRSRAGRVHVLTLLVMVWGLALAAMEVLPRVGYANDPARVEWTCQ